MEFFFTKSIAVERLISGSGANKNKEEYQSNGTIYGTILAMSPADTMLSEDNPAKEAVLYTYIDSDLKETDRLTCEGEKYIVKGVVKKELQSINLKKAIVEKMIS
jgi:hypothetical protein